MGTFYQRYYGLPAGLFITEITQDSPAEKNGMEAGDILISVDDEKIQDTDTLNRILSDRQVGETVTVVFFRRDRFYSVNMTLEENH